MGNRFGNHFWRSVLAFAAGLCLASSAAHATVLLINGAGKLTGVNDVVVGATHYNVSFVDASCVVAFSGCDSVSDFTFSSASSVDTALSALVAQMLAAPGGSVFGADPRKIYGCPGPVVNNCKILEPYGFASVSSIAERIYDLESPTVPNPLGGGTLLTTDNMVSGSSAEFVYAVFEVSAPAPNPETLWLLISGIAALAVTRKINLRSRGHAQ